MNKSPVFPSLLVTIIAAAILAACSAAATPTPVPVNTNSSAANATLPKNINVQRAAQLRESGAFVLDVREPIEWNDFHLPNTTLIPLGQLTSRVAEIPKDQPIVVVCRSGNRSQSGRDILLQAGFTNVTSMDGGLNAWRNSGLPTVSGP